MVQESKGRPRGPMDWSNVEDVSFSQEQVKLASRLVAPRGYDNLRSAAGGKDAVTTGGQIRSVLKLSHQ